ncbi:MAG: SufD family Fe-S cluster assembly protein [Oscillospiraceae bacterium]|nr:SufD family Fe-S cluster assembly protein [Oscillospiraceae bacterium]
MKTYDVTVNRLPVLTWNRLRMNETTVSQVSVPQQGSVTLSGDASFNPTADPAPFQALATGCGPALSALLEQAEICPQILTLEGTPNPVRLTFSHEDNTSSASCVCLYLKENTSAVVLMDYTAPLSAAGQGTVQTRIYLEKSAKLHLVQVQRVGRGFTFFNDIGAACQESARFELTQLILSGERSYTGCEIALEGADSSFDAGVAYALQQSDKLDMNYVVRHIGKRTNSNIDAAGSLQGNSAKLFRGTIDFVNGSAGAVGSEKEEVLLIDESCVNQTIPLILCAEEDVEGNHGASIGKPDEEVLFYLSSRGIPQEAAYALLIRAKLDAVAGRIPQDEFRQEILDAIRGGAARA